jgi:hypothetical protein
MTITLAANSANAVAIEDRFICFLLQTGSASGEMSPVILAQAEPIRKRAGDSP